MPNEVADRFGNAVALGDSIRIVAIPPDVLANIPEEERARVCSMLGEVFTVEEIDVLGNVCVQKWWHPSPTLSFSHGLTLAPSEFELASSGRGT